MLWMSKERCCCHFNYATFRYHRLSVHLIISSFFFDVVLLDKQRVHGNERYFSMMYAISVQHMIDFPKEFRFNLLFIIQLTTI